MLKIIPKVFLIVFLLHIKLFAQINDTTFYSGNYSIKVDSIIITGNEKTDNFIILNELSFHAGDKVNPKILEYNRERVYSLGIFTQVKIIPLEVDSVNIVNIVVRESWYIFPIPFLYVNNNDWGELSYGIDLLVQNFRGNNEKIRIHAGFGYDPNYLISYSNPYISRGEDIFFNSNVSYSEIKNKSQIARKLYGADFNQKVSGGNIQIGKRIGLFQKLYVNAGFKVVETPVYIAGISVSGSRIDRVFTLGAGYIYDTRDLSQFARDGLYFNSTLDFNGLNINNVNYKVFNLDIRKYSKLTHDLSIKGRIKTRLSFGGIVPYYDYSFIGYEDRLRGYYYDKMEGTSSYLASLELNYPVIKDFDLNIKFIPLLPKSLFSYRIAVYAELYADAGFAKLNGEPFSINKVNSGYGAGFTFLILPYSVFRIEYAINNVGKKQWILGIGASF
jgi:outer membrane protein assembly factor BamA